MERGIRFIAYGAYRTTTHEEWRNECLAAEQAELDELARLRRAVPNLAGELP